MTTPAAAEGLATSRGLGGARTLLPGQSPEGEYILSVLVKRTYRIVPSGVCVRAETDHEVLGGDTHWDHPMNSSVRYETDFWPFKVATDVVVNGSAHAPGGQATTSCLAAVQVGGRRQAIEVVGDRVASYAAGAAPVISDPVPFTEMPLRYERAYGGTDVFSDLKCLYPYPRNPLGRGFVVANTAKTLDDLELPNLEDPAASITPEMLCIGEYARWETCPMPVGFGWFPKVWRPRALLAGVLPRDRAIEQELRQAYAELIRDPDQRGAYLTNGFRDMDFTFFNGASAGLVFPFLHGDEAIVTENLSPEGALSFTLPGERPSIGLDIGEGVQQPEVALHTVMIDMDERLVDVVWRGAVPYRGPEWLPEMRRCEIHVE